MIPQRSFIESGLRKSDTYQKKRGIILSNYIALILCSCLVMLFVTRLLFFHNITQVTVIQFTTGSILFLLTIVLNRYHLTTLSRLYLCLLPVLFLWSVSVQTMRQMPVILPTEYDSLRIFFLALSCIPYLLLDKKQLPVFILGILPALISILFMDKILTLSGVGSAMHGVPGSNFEQIQMRTIVCFLMISTCCFAFQVIIANNDEYNQKLVNELREKTNEIEAQNEELIQSQESLNEINLHLETLVEDRTKKIRTQNETLVKYAYTNAHHVRGPVARVLGLIELSRMKTDLNYSWFFEKVEHETRAIDLIIKRIGSELEPGNQ